MRRLFIEDEEASIEVWFYHNLVGKLMVVKATCLITQWNIRTDTPLGKYTIEVLEQHINQLESNKLEANKF